MKYDLVIVGAGPAGLTLAWKSAEQGLEVIIIDIKESVDKVAYLTSGSFIDIERWGIKKEITHSINEIYFSSKNRFFKKKGSGYVINRRELLLFLYERARANKVKFLFGTRISDVEIENRHIKNIKTDKGEIINGNIYADCSGIGRVLERHFNLVDEKKVKKALGVEYLVSIKTENKTIDLYLGSHFNSGYGWLFPLNNEIAIVGYGTFSKEKFPQVRKMLDSMLTTPRLKERVDTKILEMHSGIFRTGRPLKKFNYNNLVIVGDVCLQGNPVIGEGIRFVMDSAYLASNAIAKAVKNNDIEYLNEYSKTWKQKYSKMYKAGYFLQRVLAVITKYDKITDFSVVAGSKASDSTFLTLLKGEFDYKYLIKKSIKLLII